MPEFIGLSTSEVETRRARGEGNRVRQETSRSYRDILSTNLFNPINLLLFGIGVV